MIGLLCFVLAVLASPFKSKLRLCPIANLLSFLCSVRTRTIPSSRPRFAPPSRAAAVQGGHQAGASPRHPGRPASTKAGLRSLGAMLCTVAIIASSLLSSGAAHAERALPATHRVGGLSIDPFATFVSEASKRCRARTLDTRTDAHRKRRQTTSAVVQGSHGADANHAKDLGRIAHSISSRRRSVRSARQYSGRCRLHSRAP